jgi:hypothetical protein
MKTVFEYGAMSSRYSCEAENKLTAYVTMCLYFNRSNHLIALYAPEEIKEDSWLNPYGKVAERLDEIFMGAGGMNFDEYVDEHIDEIRECYKMIKQII